LLTSKQVGNAGSGSFGRTDYQCGNEWLLRDILADWLIVRNAMMPKEVNEYVEALLQHLTKNLNQNLGG
jgi:hypothetical protein